MVKMKLRRVIILLETDSSHLPGSRAPKGNFIDSDHQFSGAMLVSGRVYSEPKPYIISGKPHKITIDLSLFDSNNMDNVMTPGKRTQTTLKTCFFDLAFS